MWLQSLKNCLQGGFLSVMGKRIIPVTKNRWQDNVTLTRFCSSFRPVLA